MKKVTKKILTKARKNRFRAELLYHEGYTGVWGYFCPELLVFITNDESEGFQVNPSWQDGESLGGVHPQDGNWCINYFPRFGES